jgi:hypothetical protein
MEVSIPAGVIPAARVQAPLRRRPRTFHCFPRGERQTRTATLKRPAAFGAAPASLAGSLSIGDCSPARCEQTGDGRGRSTRNSPQRAARVPAGASRLAGSSSEEGGALEARGVTRASLSGRARHACPVHLPLCREQGQAGRLVCANQGGRESPATLCTLPGIRTRTSSS